MSWSLFSECWILNQLFHSPLSPSLRGSLITLHFPCGSAGKESACNAGSIPRLGRSLGERKGYSLQYSGLENSMDYIVHGVTKSRTRLSDFHFCFRFLSLKWYHLHIWDYWYFSQQSWFQFVNNPAQHFVWYTLNIS